MNKILFNCLVYCSFLFLLITLFKINWLMLPKIHSYTSLLLSCFFLFSGFIFHCHSWKQILTKSSCPVTISDSIASIGLSIFSKYIPGKIWMIIGRSGYLSKQYSNYHFVKLSIISIHAQLLTIWVGLLFGIAGMLILNFYYLCLIITFFWSILTIFIFSSSAQKRIVNIIQFFFKIKIDIQTLPLLKTISLLPWFVTYWLLWSIGFYMLVFSITPSNSLPLIAALGFPLSSTIGILAIVAPGGLGVREGIMVSYLTQTNFTIKQATTIAIAARVWFLLGEVFIFIIGWIASRKKHNPL